MYSERYKSHHDAYRTIKDLFEIKTDKAGYVRELLSRPASGPRAIYLHVPFCNKICSFCPFHRPDELKRREYHGYLMDEIGRIARFPYMEAPINAVNFGGGTSTALLPEQMERVLKKLHDSFNIPKGTEISIETSISELTDEMTDVLLEGGVNRISVGVQTFDDGGRRLLGRRGSGEKAALRLEKTKKAGFTNLGVDLIYNWPGETLDILERDVEIIRDLGLAGVSFYSLILHDNTPIAGIITPEERASMADIAWDRAQFDLIMEGLGAAGYSLFELTKLIRDGLDRYDYIRVRHSGGSCIAVGHGAGGNLDRYVYRNSSHAPLLGADAPVSVMGRVLDAKYFVLDEFINDLQKTEVSLRSYSERLGFDLEKLLSCILERLADGGLIQTEGDRIRLTRDGVFWGNNIIDEFLGNIAAGQL